jgi:WD40 repeat protein
MRWIITLLLFILWALINSLSERALQTSQTYELITVDNVKRIEQVGQINNAGSVSTIAWSPDGTRLATGETCGNWQWSIMQGCKVIIWDIATGTQKRIFTMHWFENVHSVAWSPDGKLLAAAAQCNGYEQHDIEVNTCTIHIWDTMTGVERYTLEGHERAVEDLAWSPDGTMLVSASRDGRVRVWRFTPVVKSFVVIGVWGWATSVTWSPDGKYIAASGNDSTVQVNNIENRGFHDTIRFELPEQVTDIAWSPDGTRLAAAAWDVHLWNTVTWVEVGTLTPAGDLAWSPDGKLLAIGGWLVEANTGLELVRLKGSYICRIAWSPDGTRLASGDPLDGTIHLWGVSSP